MPQKNNSSVGDLIQGIESLKLKNRDLLTIEDIHLLDGCISTLREMEVQEKAQRVQESNEIFDKAFNVVLNLLKFFSENDMF